MQITVKLFFEDEVRRVSIGDVDGELTITHLKSTIDAIFPTLKHGDFRLLWKDEEGDLITISSNGEFLDAVAQMTAGGAGVVSKFHIKANPQKEADGSSSHAFFVPFEDGSAVESEAEPVHEGVQCDECGVLPIVGSRFKCSVRSDYDLCAKCEEKEPQPFPMIKMNAPRRSFSPFRGFPPGFGGRGGRGGGRFGGRCGDGGRLRGWFGGGESADHPHPSPFGDAPQAPHPWHHGPPGHHRRHSDGRGPGPRQEPLHGLFGGPGGFPSHDPLHGPGESLWGRGCGGWREALRRRMEQGGVVPPTAPLSQKGPAPASAGVAVHQGVGCDECRMLPIVGPRYKCAVREDYDLCAGCERRRCEAKSSSEKTLFPMLKIDRPEQAPGTFVYIFNKRSIHGGLHGAWGGAHRGGGQGRGLGHRLGYGHGHHGHRHHEADGGVSSAVHRHVNCDQCGASPITGPRFKCAVRSDYDLCATCAATFPQPFPMVKIYHPQHRPSTIVYAAALSVEKAARPVTAPAVQNRVHPGVRCDECQVFPIVGARFQCIGRPNYDLCAGCEARKAFQPFPMVKITDPSQSPVDLVYEVRGGKPRATTALAQRPAVHHGVRCDQCNKSPIEGARYKCTVRDDFDLCAVCEASSAQPHPVIKIYDPQHHPSKLVYAFHCKPESSIAASAPAVAPPVQHVPTTASAAAQLPRPSLRFVRDRSLPDGTTVLLGEQGLRKLWDVRNDGLHGWPVGSMLVFAGGDVLHSGSPVGEPVPLLQPGEEGQLAVSLAVPQQTGRFVSYYRMQTAEGQNFGQRLWADIVVANPPVPSDAPPTTTPATATALRSPFIQGMDDRAQGAAAVPVQEAIRAPFIQGMDAHMKELEMLQAVAAMEEQEAEDRRLQEQLRELNLEHQHTGDFYAEGEEEEEELLLKQVMAEQTTARDTVEDHGVSEEQGRAEVPVEVSVDSIPADCVPAEAALSPAPPSAAIEKEEERWALVASVEGLEDDEDTSSEYSTGVHQPASASASALLSAPRDMTASYDNACADLDVEVHDDREHRTATSEEAEEQDLEFVDALGASASERSSAAVESKEPEGAESPRGVSSPSPVLPDPPLFSALSAPSQEQPGVVDSVARWHRELQMLMDMGFEDMDALIPLLEKHVRVPASARAESGVDALGLHAVLATLLN